LLKDGSIDGKRMNGSELARDLAAQTLIKDSKFFIVIAVYLLSK
jgi:hypothetical protein